MWSHNHSGPLPYDNPTYAWQKGPGAPKRGGLNALGRSFIEQLRAVADSGRVDVLLTTGGTGIGPRDNTPEATQAVADRIVPGLSEEMCRKGLEQTPTAVLSRGTAAVRTKTLIVNLPGSPKGAVESLEAVAHLLPHAVEVLHGARHD